MMIPHCVDQNLHQTSYARSQLDAQILKRTKSELVNRKLMTLALAGLTALPVIGLGSSKPVSQIAERGTEPIAAVLRALVANGGSVVDTWPRNRANDEAFGRVISEPDLRNALFVTSKIDRSGKQAGIEQFRETQSLYQRNTIDLLQVFNLTDINTQWANLQDLKASGQARYIGVTVSSASLYDQLASFVRREQPDFVQVNYSITERDAEQRMLPMMQDKGIGVIITDHSVEQTLEIVDRAYIMYDGKIRVSGTVSELVWNDEVAEIYLGPILTQRMRQRFAAPAMAGQDAGPTV